MRHMKTGSRDERRCWIYILECGNNTLYTGYTTDIIKRYRAHLSGKVKYTRGFKPRRIARCWRLLDTKGTAMKIEHFIKKMSREEKLYIILNPISLQPLAAAYLGSDINLIPDDPAAIEKAAFDTKTARPEETAITHDEIPGDAEKQ